MDTGERSIATFLEALGSSAPAPGGGAASALAGSMAAALVEMVARFTVSRKKYAAVEERAAAILSQAEQARQTLLALADEDERAYQQVSAAYRLSKATDEERDARDLAIQSALLVALQPPLRVMRAARAVVGLAQEIAEIGNGTVVSDAGAAALLGQAAAQAASLNVQGNAHLLHDVAQHEAALTEMNALMREIVSACAKTQLTTYQRMLGGGEATR
jgi:formiminotetrahydrofolate cyclodeaminase